MPVKAGFRAEYTCTCGVTLRSVSDHAVTAHLNGHKHKTALDTQAKFEDFTCKCGSSLKHVKRYQIDQHLAGAKCKAKLAAMKQQRCILNLVDPLVFGGSDQEEEACEEELPAAMDMEEALDMEEAPGMDQTVWVHCPGTHVKGLTEDNFVTHYPYGIHKPGGVANCPPIVWVPGE